MIRIVNLQINRNMSALPDFSFDCSNFQSTYQQGIAHALGKIWVLFSVSVGQNGKSTDQQAFARYTLFSSFLVSDTETGQSTDQRGNDAHTGKNWVLILGQWWSGWEINGSTGFCALYIIFRFSGQWHWDWAINWSTGKWHTHWENLSFSSWAVIFRMVNQQINGVLRTIPGKFELHSQSVLGRTLRPGNQLINGEMTHKMEKIAF